VDTLEDMEQAVRSLNRIERAECRRDAETRFCVERMVDGYEAIYRSLAGQARSA